MGSIRAEVSSGLREESPQQDLDASAERVAATASDVVRDWLRELEHSKNGVLRACSARQLEQAFLRYVRDAAPQPALRQALVVCSAEDLESASRLLRARAARLSPATHGEARLQLEVLTFASALRTLSFDRPERKGPAAGPESRSHENAPEVRPTEMLWHTAAALRSAKTAGAVERALLESALELCEAAGAVWWTRAGEELKVGAGVGLGPAPEAATFRPTRRFWGETGRHREAVLALSLEIPEHAAFLQLIPAAQGVIVRLWEGHRWTGALSVFDGIFDEERLDLLAADRATRGGHPAHHRSGASPRARGNRAAGERLGLLLGRQPGGTAHPRVRVRQHHDLRRRLLPVPG